MIADLNPTLRGWFEYFKHSYAPNVPQLDGWIRRRLRSILRNAAEAAGDRRCTGPIRHAGRMPSLPSMGCSACRTPMTRSVNPLVGKTTDWRAGCGRSATSGSEGGGGG